MKIFIKIIFLITIFISNPVFSELIENLDMETSSEYHCDSDKLVIFIEDAHCNYPAQKKLAEIISKIISKTNIDCLAVEGSQGNIITHFFATYPIKTVRRKIAGNLLKKGIISGEEYYSISSGNPLRIVGVDQKDLYKKNISYFTVFHEKYDEINEFLKNVSKANDEVKQKTYSKELLFYDNGYQSYSKGDIKLDDFISLSFKVLNDTQTEKKYPEVNKILDFSYREKKINYELIDFQAKQVINFFIKNNGSDKSKIAANLFIAHLNGTVSLKNFYQKTYNLIDKTNEFEKYSEFLNYIAFLEEKQNFKKDDFDSQFNQLIDDCFLHLIESKNQKNFYELQKNFESVKKLISLRLTSKEYYELKDKNIINVFKLLAEQITFYNLDASSIKNRIPFITFIIKNNLNFYNTASERDMKLFTNSVDLIKNNNFKKIILIAGGFHKTKILDEFKKNQISYIVISPNEAEQIDFHKYSSVLLRQNYFDGLTTQNIISQPILNDLRATSFFAEQSFDDINRIVEFRNNFVFRAIIESVDQFNYQEIYEIVKSWRIGFFKALSLRYSENSTEFKNAKSLFDYLITDSFKYGNVTLDSENQSIILVNSGKLLKFTKQADGSITFETLTDNNALNRIKRNIAIKKSPIFLQNSQVFISSWALPDKSSPNSSFEHSTYTTAKYIEALNARRITPTIILPQNKAEQKAVLKSYANISADTKYRVKFAVYDDEKNNFIELDINGIPVADINIDANKKPIIVQVSRNIDPKSNSRLIDIQNRFKKLGNAKINPQFIRILSIGSSTEQIKDMDLIDLHFLPVPPEELDKNDVQGGFFIDTELIDLITAYFKVGKEEFRDNIIDEIDENIAQGTLKKTLNSIDGFKPNEINSLHWTFRNLKNISDSELAAYFKAAAQSDKKQVVFTFYKDTPKDRKHKDFLKRNFKFIDLQENNNNQTDSPSNILVINLPVIPSDLFKGCLAAADTSVVSGENSFMEAIFMNKFGLGPSTLFKPTWDYQIELLDNILTANGHDSLFNKLKNYADISDDSNSANLDEWKPTGNLTESEQFIHDIMFDPQTNFVIRSVLSESIAEGNGLNTFNNIIEQIDSNMPSSEIVVDQNLTTYSLAQEIIDYFQFSDDYEFDSVTDLKEFLNTQFLYFIRKFIMQNAFNANDSDFIWQQLFELSKNIMAVYQQKLGELGIDNKSVLTLELSSNLNIMFSSLEIAGEGHMFIPKIIDGTRVYQHYFIDWHAFVPKSVKNKNSEVKYEIISADTKNRLVQDYNDLNYVKQLIEPFFQDGFFQNFSQVLLPFTFNGTKKQKDILVNHAALSSLDFFRSMVAKYSSRIIANYGTANMKTFYEFVKTIIADDARRDKNMDVINEIVGLSVLINSDSNTGTTNFFRDEQNWSAQLQNYINDLIIQKVANNEFDLSIRSVGSAIGKEAYSISAIVENALVNYASKYVYPDVEGIFVKADLVRRWVDMWNVKVYTFDNSFQRLATGKEGIYVLDDTGHKFLTTNKSLRRMFSEQYPGDGFYPLQKVSDRLNRWIVPVFIDLSEDLSPLERYPGEVTFAMNLLKYLKNYKQVVSVLKDSTNPDYKAFVAYNYHFNDPPNRHGAVEGQPFVLPSSTNPDFDLISKLANLQGVGSESKMASILGISLEQFETITASQNDLRSKEKNINRNAQNLELIDSML